MPSVRTAPFPGFIRPALATLETSAPGSSGWVHELKFDGYRLQVRIRAGEVALLTRRGLDRTYRFGEELRTALLGLPVQSAILDGEVVVLAANGLPSFAALKEALSEGDGRFVFYAFDLLYLDGRDLRDLPLLERKAALAKITTPGRVHTASILRTARRSSRRHAPWARKALSPSAAMLLIGLDVGKLG